MAACNFTIPFEGPAEKVLAKAKAAVESQSGNFNGNTESGNFDVSIFGNTIEGAYTVSGQDLQVVILSKPFMIPCSAIEGFLKSQVTK
jgi:hypothetical protein